MALFLSRTATKNRPAIHQFYKFSVKSFSLSALNQQQKQHSDKSDITISKSSDQSNVSTDVRPLGERIKENTKTASYFGVILGGVVVTGGLFLAIFKELFSSSSPNSVYSDALKLCVDNTRIQDLLGTPIKGYGEETRRRRRQHVAHSLYERNGKKFIRMQFYIQGIRNKATVQLEKDLDSSRYRYLFVQLDHYPRETVIIEDNRSAVDEDTSNQSLNDLRLS